MPRRQAILIAGGLLYAAAGLAASLIWFPIGDLDVESDFYAELGPAAQRIAAGDLDVRHHPYKGPLQPLLTAVLHGVLGPVGISWYRCAVLLSLASGLLALGATYRLARAVADDRVAIAAVVLAGATHLVFVNSHKAASDMLFLGLVTAGVAVTLAEGPARPRRWFAAGLLAGAAFLTRYIGGLLPPWIVATACLRPPDGSPRRRRRDAVLAVSGFLVVAAPWFLFSETQTGALLWSRNTENVAREFGAGAPMDHAVRLLGNIPRRAVEFARTGIGITAGLAALGGMAVSLRRRPGWRLRALLAWAVVYLVGMASVFYVPRFALPLVPVLTLLIACLLVGGTLPWLAARRHALGWLGVAAFIAVWVPRTLDVERFNRAGLPVHLRGVIAYLAPMSGDHAPVLMARKAHAAFLAGVPWRPYPTHELSAQAFVADAALRGVDLILAGPVERALGAGGFAMETLDHLAGLTRVHASDGNVVYRLDRTLPPDRLGRDPQTDVLAARFEGELAARELRAAVATGEKLAFARLQAGEALAAQSALEALVTTFGDAPAADLLRVRLNLAWLCLKSGDHKLGAAALEGLLKRYADGGDRLYEARANDYLGRHLAALGRAGEARLALRRAADLYAGLQLEAEQASAEASLDELP